MIKGILTSLIITFLVSSGVSYFLTSFNVSFLKSFIFTTAIQFVIFYFYNEFKRSKINKFTVEKLSETELQFEQSGADVVCANCKKEVFAPIELPEPSNFTCPHCGSENSVYLNIETAVVTRPV
jgi:transcription elongation factor Elf1